MNQLRIQSLQFNTENKGFSTNTFRLSGRIDNGSKSTLCKKTTWKTSKEMEESVYIKIGFRTNRWVCGWYVLERATNTRYDDDDYDDDDNGEYGGTDEL